MLDTKGPEIRTGKLENGEDVKLVKGQVYTFTTDYSFVGNSSKGAISYANITKVTRPGDRILADDGNIEFVIEEIGSDFVRTRVGTDAVLGQTKNVNLPGVPIDLPPVTEKDIDDLKFGVEQGIDFVAASFMRNGAAVRALRDIFGLKGKNIKIISKIESQEGLDNFDGILEESDGIMVARGDLGVNIPIEQVSLAQKMMIRKCNIAGKIVVTATQMLESMIQNPNPTRAEATDVANAVFDGTDCVMLSGETAKGAYPVKAVKMMAEICREAESNIDYQSTFQIIREMNLFGDISIAEAIASSAVKTAIDCKAALLIVLTETGRTARYVAKYRPAAPILCITADEQVARQAIASRGILPLLVGSMKGADSLIARAIEVAKRIGMCKVGDVVVATTGSKEGVSGLTNNLKVLTVDY
jgi:pyruvate kinase